MEAVTAVTEWIVKHGGCINSVKIKNISEYEGYGVVCSESLKAGSKTISIPWILTMNIDSALQSDLKHIFEAEPTMDHNEVLALHLMFEKSKAKDSFWHLFIETLPKTFDSPLYWSETDQSYLQDTNVYLLTKMMEKQLVYDYENIHVPLMEQYPDFFLVPIPFEEYQWAMSIIWSRAFGFRNQKVLCPLMDMFNHDVTITRPLDDFIAFDETTQMLQHSVPENVSINQALSISYGNYSNAKLLYSYGFVDPLNHRRGIDFWINVPPNDPYREFKCQLLASHGIQNTYDFSGTLLGDSISKNLLATVRIIVMIPAEHCNAEASLRLNHAISDRNERAVVDTLLRCLRRKKIQQKDITTDSSNRQRMANQVVLEDKKVLQNTIKYLEEYF